jgi:hypothetical protein
VAERRLDAARVHCQEARESLVKAACLHDHEGQLMEVEARISQVLSPLPYLHYPFLHLPQLYPFKYAVYDVYCIFLRV